MSDLRRRQGCVQADGVTSCSLKKLKPIIYDEENWRYLAVGEKAADAFKCGLVFKKA